MADNSVFITGVADGAFESALGDLPAWATEDTAQSIEETLRKTLSLQTKALTQLVKSATSGDNSLDAKKVNDELAKLVKNLADEDKQDPKRRKRNKETEEEFGKQKKRWKAEKEEFDKSAFVTAAWIAAGLKIKAAFEDNIKTYDDLTAAGINVLSGMEGLPDGFQALRQLTAETGVRFTELSASMTKYSSAVNSFGVGKFAKTVGQASTNLAAFGYNSKETADILGAYLSIQQNINDVSSKTSEETNKDLLVFGKSIYKLSQMTGMSRQAIIANVEALSQSTDANVLAGQIGDKAAEGMTSFLASFKDQNIAKQLLKLISDPIAPLNETFMNLQKVGLGGFGQSLTTFTKSLEGQSEESKAQAMKSYMETYKMDLDAAKQRLMLLKQAGVDGAAASLDFIVGLQQQSNKIKPLNAEELKRQEASNKASKEFANELEKFKSLIQRAFGPTTEIMNVFWAGLKVVNGILTGIISLFDELSKGLTIVVNKLGIAGTIDLSAWAGVAVIGFALYKTLSLFGTPLKTILKSMLGVGKAKEAVGGAGKWTTSLGADGSGGNGPKGPGMLEKIAKGTKAVVDGIGDTLAKLSKAIGESLGSLSKGIGDMISNLAKGIGSAIQSLAEGIGGAIAALGKGLGTGIGKLLEGALKGLAAGLTFMADPLILLGAAILAGSILLIGGAIAGATWLMGAALPKFAEGLKSFDDINGDNLVSVAKGIGAIGLAMSVFGAGAAVGAVGGVLGTLAGGFSKLFGDGSLIDQLKMFASMGPNLVLAGTGIITVTTSISMLSSALGSFAGLDTLKSIVNTINSIDIAKALVFGALGKFTGVSLPAPTSTKGVSTPTSPKASTLNSPSQVSTNANSSGEQAEPKEAERASGTGIEKPGSNSGINSELGYQSSLLEQLLLSTNNLVSVNKDILKYARVNT